MNNILEQDVNSSLLSELVLRIIMCKWEQNAGNGGSSLVLKHMGRVCRSAKHEVPVAPQKYDLSLQNFTKVKVQIVHRRQLPLHGLGNGSEQDWHNTPADYPYLDLISGSFYCCFHQRRQTVKCQYMTEIDCVLIVDTFQFVNK